MNLATGIALAAVIVPTITVSVNYWLTHRKLTSQDQALQQVHVLVNDRLDAALSQIETLKAQVLVLQAQGKALQGAPKSELEPARRSTPP